jgi:tape measure domain-containing protein
MTATIDKRVVEMSFENDRFEKGVGTSLGTIDRLKRALNFDNAGKSFSGITDAANRVNLGSISDGVNHISNRFSALGIMAVTTLVNIANSAYQTGAALVRSLTIDPVKAGLNEYETKLNSVQTILANTQKEGTNLEIVTRALNDLNAYSDKTIYNFQQMARNIGTFTAAGVKLDASVASIKGIANLAAISGSNADQASTAMYQLSQALSSGTVKLMDWNSVVNAGMGGQVFQDAIKETARVHGVAIDDMIKQDGSFRETLQRGWFTSEILTETLSKFTGDLNAEQLKTMGYTEEQIASIIKMGQTANDAATKVKTFTQLFDTLREAAQSGWAQTWEIIIGDFEEAKSFLTTLNNWIGGFIGASANARNQMLQGWKDLGGRTKLIEAFQNALNTIVGIINPMKEAFREFFPPTTAKNLLDLTEAIRKFSEKVKMAVESTDRIKRAFRGVFAVADIVRMAIVSLVTNFLKLIGSFSKTGDSAAEMVAKFGDWLVKLRDSIKEADTFNVIFGNIIKVVKPAIEGIVGFFAALINGFKNTEHATKSDSLANFLREVGEKFKSFGKLGEIVANVFGLVAKAAEKLGPIVGKIASKLGDLVNSLLDAMTRGLDKLDTGKILDILNKGLLGGVLVSLNSFINQSKSVIGGGLFAGILLSIKNFIDNGGEIFKNAAGILDKVKGSLEAYQKTLKANALLKIAGAIGILALSIIALTMVDQTKLVNATAVIGAMFVGLSSTLDVFEKTTDGGKKMLVLTASLLGISTALLILSGAVLILGKLDPKEALQGVLAVGSVLGLLLLFQKFSGGFTGLIGATTGLVALSVSMLALGVAVRSFGSMDLETLVQGLIGMGAALAIIGTSMQLMSTSMSGAGALLVASGAILVLSVSLKALGSLSLEQIGIALLALAGALTVLGVAGALLTPVAPTIVLVAASLLAIGVAVAAIGVGIGAVGLGLGALAAGIVALAGLSSVAIGTLTLVITGLAALIPMLAVQAAKGFTAFVVEVAKSAPKIAFALLGIGAEMLKGFSKLIPQVVDTVLNLITTLLISLTEKLPLIIEMGYKLLLGFLTGLKNNIGAVVTTSIDIVNAYLNAVASKIPDIVDSGWNLIIAWVDGMKDGVKEHLPQLMDSVSELGWAVIEGFTKGLVSGHGNALAGIIEVGRIIVDGFKNFLGIHSPSTVFVALALDLIRGLILGLVNNAFLVVTEITKLGKKIVDGLKTKYSDMVSAGKDLVRGFADGIKSFIGTAVDNAARLAQAVLDKIKNVMGIHSPSDETFDMGMNADKGMANGISAFAHVVLNSVRDMGRSTLNGFNSVISQISDSINSDLEFAPSIRPVLDLTNIQNGSSQIQGLLGQQSINVSAAALRASSITTRAPVVDTSVDQAASPASNISFTQINNSPKELSRLDIYRQTRNQLLQAKGLVGA